MKPPSERPTPAPREDAEYLAALRGEDPTGETTRALTSLLRRNVARVLRDASPEDLDDLAQETLRRLVVLVDRFRGDSSFTTFAIGVAVRVAFTERRRRFAAGAAGRAVVDAALETARELACPKSPTPGDALQHEEVFAALRAAIAETLTDRQREAIVAELSGVPTVEIARRLGATQNALYKLVHDARKKLRAALDARGFGVDAARAALKEPRS